MQPGHPACKIIAVVDSGGMGGRHVLARSGAGDGGPGGIIGRRGPTLYDDPWRGSTIDTTLPTNAGWTTAVLAPDRPTYSPRGGAVPASVATPTPLTCQLYHIGLAHSCTLSPPTRWGTRRSRLPRHRLLLAAATWRSNELHLRRLQHSHVALVPVARAATPPIWAASGAVKSGTTRAGDTRPFFPPFTVRRLAADMRGDHRRVSTRVERWLRPIFPGHRCRGAQPERHLARLSVRSRLAWPWGQLQRRWRRACGPLERRGRQRDCHNSVRRRLGGNAAAEHPRHHEGITARQPRSVHADRLLIAGEARMDGGARR